MSYFKSIILIKDNNTFYYLKVYSFFKGGFWVNNLPVQKKVLVFIKNLQTDGKKKSVKRIKGLLRDFRHM